MLSRCRGRRYYHRHRHRRRRRRRRRRPVFPFCCS